MKWTLSILTALMLLGCSNEQSSSSASSAPQETKLPAALMSPPATEAEPSAIEETTPTPQTPAATTEAAGTNTTEKPADIPIPAASGPVDGATLFAQRCVACHGQKAEKKALGKSQVIAGWESAKIASAFNGYNEGTYGGEMKAVMQAQAKTLNSEQIEAVAEYISGL